MTGTNSYSRVLAPVCHLSFKQQTPGPLLSAGRYCFSRHREEMHASQPRWGWPAARKLHLISMLMAIIILKINTCNHNIHQ